MSYPFGSRWGDAGGGGGGERTRPTETGFSLFLLSETQKLTFS